MGLSIRDAVRLEAAIHGDALEADIYQLMRALGARLMLGWHGKWVELCVAFDGDRLPRPFLKTCRKWTPESRPVDDDPRAVDFRDRLDRVMALHHGAVLLGIDRGGVAKCQLVMPKAPRLRPTDPPFALRFLRTEQGAYDMRKAPEVDTHG